MGLGLTRNLSIYVGIKELFEQKSYSINELCSLAGISRSSYYKWINREQPLSEMLNEEIAELVMEIHTEHPDMGYRRLRDELEKNYGIPVNDKRVLRICRNCQVRSTIKYRSNGCTVSSKHPEHVAENVLGRKFKAEKPNEKWLTDVTEFKYYLGEEKHKVYLSAILDLYDKRIVSYVIGDSNNNELVFNTFDKAIELEPDAHPLFHSDRGFQYTTITFHNKLVAAGMSQSMSRVGKCIDNGPMEGFWGMLKREKYYGRKFKDRESLIFMIEDYIDYYNNKRLQRKLGVMSPIEKYSEYLIAA